MAEQLAPPPNQVEGLSEAVQVPVAHTSANHQFFFGEELTPEVREVLPRELDDTYRVLRGEQPKPADAPIYSFQFGFGPQDQLVVGRNGFSERMVTAMVESTLQDLGITIEVYEDPSLVPTINTLPLTPPDPDIL